MRCLLDKVTVRFAVQGLLKLARRQRLEPTEIFTLDFLEQAEQARWDLLIAPPSWQILQQFARSSAYAPTIHFFLNQVQVAEPTRYFKRWARRLRERGFTREDAAILALATFGTDEQAEIIGMNYVATFDQPMINHWAIQHTALQTRLTTMQRDIPAPYQHALLPTVLRPDILIAMIVADSSPLLQSS